MCRCWCDLGIAPSGVEAFLRDRRIIVEVDQVVCHAGMLRLALCDPFQDGRTFELVSVGLVRWRSRGIEGQRIVNLRLVIAWMTLRQLLHRLGIGVFAQAGLDLVEL